MQNTGLDEAQPGIKIARRNINLKYADHTTLLAESEEELKSLLMKVKEDESIAVSHSTSYTTSVLTSFTTIQRFPETPISSL